MDDLSLLLWKKELESRTDLTSLYKNKTIHASIVQEDGKFNICFQSGKIYVPDTMEDIQNPDVMVEAPNQAIDAVFKGHERLSKLPSSIARVTGNYRDILFLESILYLASSNLQNS